MDVEGRLYRNMHGVRKCLGSFRQLPRLRNGAVPAHSVRNASKLSLKCFWLFFRGYGFLNDSESRARTVPTVRPLRGLAGKVLKTIMTHEYSCLSVTFMGGTLAKGGDLDWRSHSNQTVENTSDRSCM